jgi:hypothetical protein
MGPGEYLYLYTLIYHSWLGHPPDEGVVTKAGAGDRGEELFSGGDGTFSADRIRRRYRRMMLALTANQLAGVPAGEIQWREALSRERRQLETNPGWVLWRDGLPEQVETSLAPYRGRLEAAYSRNTNLFELPPGDDEEWNLHLD